jgi:hypothetical protein
MPVQRSTIGRVHYLHGTANLPIGEGKMKVLCQELQLYLKGQCKSSV